MITFLESRYELSDNVFDRSKTIIDRSGVPATIEDYYGSTKGVGGQSSAGIDYTIHAVLVCALTLIMLNRTPSLKAILNTIGDLNPAQLAQVGMSTQDVTRIFGTPPEQKQEFGRFTAWLHRRLRPLDSHPDQPAKRITNAEHQRIIAARTPAQRADCLEATRRLRLVVNDIIKGSIVDPQPLGAAGDLVVDESIFDLAGPSAGLGSRPDKNRGAASCARYYSRDHNTGAVSGDKDQRRGKQAFGLGVTTLIRIGAGNHLHSVSPVIVAADIHHPTSGSVDAVRICIEQMRRNGLDTRPQDTTTWPRFTVDMGYSTKRDFPRLMFDQKYTGIFRYPITTTLSEPSGNTQGPNSRPFGPIQYAGAFYCPAAERLLRGHRVPKTRDLLAAAAWHSHDDKLRAVLPFLMGTNSRPFLASTRGRPRIGALPAENIKMELVCPAVQGRVQCPLKPASMRRGPFGTPMAEPDWPAEERQCCAHSTVTVTLTGPQLQKAQWGPPAGSWEHTLYLEAARSLTERSFSVLKSPHVTGMAHMKWGPRREPMIKILFALAIAAANDQIQRTHHRNVRREESIDIRWRQLHTKLGHEPARTPPRT